MEWKVKRQFRVVRQPIAVMRTMFMIVSVVFCEYTNDEAFAEYWNYYDRNEGYKNSQSSARVHANAFNYQDTSSEDDGYEYCGIALLILSICVIIVTFPVAICLCVKVVHEYERAVIFRLGRLSKGGAKGPGIYFVIPCTDEYRKVDLRTLSFDVPPQEILTKDSVTIAVDAVVHYRVQDATASIANVADADGATRLLAQMTLRNMLGTKNLSQVLTDREEISAGMQVNMDEATDPWGIKVERVEIEM